MQIEMSYLQIIVGVHTVLTILQIIADKKL